MSATSPLLDHPVVEKHDILSELVAAIFGPQQQQQQHQHQQNQGSHGPWFSAPSSPSPLFHITAREAISNSKECNSNKGASSKKEDDHDNSDSEAQPRVQTASSTLVTLCLQACTHGAATR